MTIFFMVWTIMLENNIESFVINQVTMDQVFNIKRNIPKYTEIPAINLVCLLLLKHIKITCYNCQYSNYFAIQLLLIFDNNDDSDIRSNAIIVSAPNDSLVNLHWN
jgi:hypothetical protein